MRSLRIDNARLFSPADGLDAVGSVLVEKGRVAAVGRVRRGAEETVDARGLHLFPGFIDLHAHAREPGYEEAEDLASCAEAALAGGFTSVVAMPNTNPPADTPEMIRTQCKRAERLSGARLSFAGKLSKGDNLTEMAEMALVGAVMFTDDGEWVANGNLMRHAMEYAAGFGLLVATHAEDPALADGGCAHYGENALALGLKGVIRAAESAAVARDVLLARETRCRLHLMHLSALDSISALEYAKRAGAPVTAEVTPHHLLFDDDVLARFDPVFRVNPPLRAREDRTALLGALASDLIDCIATDHAPHTEFEKKREWQLAPPGIAGLETAFSSLYTHLVKSGDLGLDTLVRALTSGPARVLGWARAGRLRVGASADLVAFDLTGDWRVEGLRSKSSNTPFTGQKLSGRLRFALVRGKAYNY